MTTWETKQYSVVGRVYTLVLKQIADDSWECEAYEGNQIVVDARRRITKRDAQFAGHAALYELHTLRCDQQCQDDCDKDWTVVPKPLIDGFPH